MVLGLILLAGGLYLFLATNYLDRTNIIIVGVLARFVNGLVLNLS
jgi:hypothetical protein